MLKRSCSQAADNARYLSYIRGMNMRVIYARSLLSSEFYEALWYYNEDNPLSPIYLIQGILAKEVAVESGFGIDLWDDDAESLNIMKRSVNLVLLPRLSLH